MSASVKKRLAELRRQIERHNQLYYEQAAPEISDTEFDALLRELRDLESIHPDLVTADSPTQKVGGAPSAAFPTVSHAVPMLSLDNTYDLADLRAFHARVVKQLGHEEQDDGAAPASLGFAAQAALGPQPTPPSAAPTCVPIMVTGAGFAVRIALAKLNMP